MRILDHFDFTTWKPITKSAVDFARGASAWDLGNRTLYDLCQNHPGHNTTEEIIAKIWLIGRSYAASIERRRNADQFGDGFYEATVAPTVKESAIDEWLTGISNDDVANTVVIHKKLMDLFASITGGLEKRSLTSKYLHFHKPGAFFIYDSRARQAITKVVPRLNQLPKLPAAQFDKEYKDFVRRCLWLRSEISSKHGVILTPREIDKLLLAMADKGSFTGVSISKGQRENISDVTGGT